MGRQQPKSEDFFWDVSQNKGPVVPSTTTNAKMNLSALYLVTFDLMNTLLDHRMSIGTQIERVAYEYELSCNSDQLERTYHKVWNNMTKLYPNFGIGNEQFEDWEHFLHWVYFEVIFEHSPETERWKIDLMCIQVLARQLSPLLWKRAPGMLSILKYLASKQVRMGVITNFDPRVKNILSNMHLGFFFQFTLSSYNAEHRKPETEIFRKAEKLAERYGIKPENCLHIGDRVEEDYWGARRAGWNAFLIHRNKPYDERGVDKDFVFADLGGVLKRLRQKDVIFEKMPLRRIPTHPTTGWQLPTTSTLAFIRDYSYGEVPDKFMNLEEGY